MAPFVVLQRIGSALYINLSYILESITHFSYYWGIDLPVWHVLFIYNFDFEYGVQCKKNLHKIHSSYKSAFLLSTKTRDTNQV